MQHLGEYKYHTNLILYFAFNLAFTISVSICLSFYIMNINLILGIFSSLVQIINIAANEQYYNVFT